MILYPIIDRSGFLEGDSPEVRAIGSLARSLPSQVVEANLALNHFISCVAEQSSRPERSPERSIENWQRAGDERREIEREIRANAGIGEYDRADWDSMRLQVDLEVLRRQLERGEEPERYAFHRPFLFAKSFVFCLDRIHKILGACQHYPVSQKPAEDAVNLIDSRLPDLKEFRNSIAHYEDRVRGRGRGRKDIELQPLDTPMIKAENGALVLECLENDVFRSILADGSLGAIPIRGETLEVIQAAVQNFLDSLPWTHPHVRLVPSP